MMNFSIAQWRAWAPDLDHQDIWKDWAQRPYCPLGPGTPPDVSFLPAIQRRRLSPMARMVFACAWPLAEGVAPMPVVFASLHGETSRTFGLMRSLSQDEPLSPTAFGLSVHNAIAGLWSIIRREPTESVALCVANDGLEHAFIEACTLLAQGHANVLVVVTEERPPEQYAPWIEEVPFAYATAFRVVAGKDWAVAPTTADGPNALWPNALNLVRHLALGTSTWRNSVNDRAWTWTRTN